MFLTNQGSTAGVDKENVGTPVRSKMMTTQNTPVPGLRLASLATPGRPCTPVRKPLAQVNQDLQQSTPRMLSKPLMTPRLQGTPKRGSKTPGKKSKGLSRRSVTGTRENQYQWKDNMHRIADDMTDKIIKEELSLVCQQIKMKLNETHEPKVSCDILPLSQDDEYNNTRVDMAVEHACVSTPSQSSEQSVQRNTEVSHLLDGICSQIVDMELAQKRTESSSVNSPLHDLVSLLDPLKDWTLGSVVSLLTPVKTTRLSDKHVDRQVMNNSTGTVMTPCRHKEMSSGMTPVRCINISSGVTPVKHVEMSSEMTPVRHAEMSSEMTPVKHVETSSGMTPIRHVEISSEMTPVRHVEMSSEMTPVRHMEMSSEMTPVRHVEMSSEMTPVRHVEMSSEMTPVKHVEMSSEMTPVKHVEMSSEMTPVKHVEMSSEMTPVKHVEMSSEMTPVRHVEMSSEMTPVKHVEMSSEITPVKHVEMSSEMTPVRHVEMSSEMTPVRHADTASDPIPIDSASLSTMTSPVKVSHVEVSTEMTEMVNAEVGTTPVKVVDSGCGMTPAQMINSGCGMTPARMTDNSTSITPVTYSEAEMSTSPMVIPVFRWEAANLQNVDTSSLLDHLETASISNQLLRREVQMWMDKHDGVTKQLSKAREDKKVDIRRQEQTEKPKLDKLAKASLEKDNEDLMSQIGEQMMQIGELQNAVSRKSNEIEAVQCEKVECQEQYQKEIHNLQEDLKTSYRQHQQQISELEDELQKNDYKAHYQRSQDSIKSLQMELEAYSGLNDTMQQATRIQEEFGCMEETLANVTMLFHKTMEKKTKWQAENEAMRSQSEAHLLNVKEMQTQLHQLEQKCQGLTSTNIELDTNLTRSQECRTLLLADLNLSRTTVDNQQTQLDSQAVELENLRAQQHQMKEKIQNLEDNTEFIEEERRSLLDASKDADDNLRVTSLELSRCKVALEESEAARKQWENAVEDLSERFQETQSELDNTKAYAHYMLLNQASEMRDAAQGLDGLHQEMNVMMQQLKDTMGLDLMKDQELSPIKDSSSPSLNSCSPSSGATSIVASVLSALQIKGSSTPKENSSIFNSPTPVGEVFDHNLSDYEQREMMMADSIRESTGGRILIGQSSGSAFTSLNKLANSNASSGSAFTSLNKSANSSVPSKSPVPVKETDSMTSLDGRGSDNGPLLLDQVGQMRLILGCVLKGLVAHATTLQVSLQDIKDERDSIQKNATKSRQNFDSELSLVQEQLRASEAQERMLQQELANTRAKMCDLEQNLQYGEQRVQGMAHNLARFSDQKYTIEKLRHDMEVLTAAHKASETEKAALQQVLDDLVSQINSNDGGHKGSEVYGAVIKENCKLKMEIEKLRMKMLERKQHYEGLNARANRQMRVLEGNWKKAEAEIYRLDEIFDKCKQLIQKLPPAEDEDASLVSLRGIFE